MRDPIRSRGAITQPGLALGSVTTHPLAGAADTDSGGLGRLVTVRSPSDNTPAELPTAFQTERRVSVQIHPVSSFGTEVAWQLSASKGARMDQPTQELHLGRRRTAAGRILGSWAGAARRQPTKGTDQ